MEEDYRCLEEDFEPFFPNVDDDTLPKLRDDSKHTARTKYQRRKVFCGACAFLVAGFALFLAAWVPGLLQSSVDDLNLELGIVNMTDPNTNSVLLTASATLHLNSPSPCEVAMEPSRLDFKVFDEGSGGGYKTIGQLHAPHYRISGGSKKVAVTFTEALLEVSDLDAWKAFTKTVITADQVAWQLHGEVSAVLKPLPGLPAWLGGNLLRYTGIRLAVAGKSAGMGGFANPFPYISSYDAFSTDLESPPTQLAHIRLFNPSQFSLQPIGVVSMDMIFKSASMGWTLTTAEVTLHTGWNSFALTGPLEPTNMTDMSLLMSRFYGGETSEIVVRISNHTSTDGTYSPASSVQLYSQAVQGLEIPTVLKYMEGKTNLTTEVFWGVGFTRGFEHFLC